MGSQKKPAGAGKWDNRMRGKKMGGKSLCDLLEMRSQRKGRPQLC